MSEKRESAFTLNPFQIVFSLLLLLALIIFSIGALTSSNRSLRLSIGSKDSITRLEVALEVRHDISLFDIAFGQWSTGRASLGEVIDARDTLWKSLGVSKGSAKSISQIGNPRLSELLVAADQLFAQAKPGYLPIKSQDQLLASSQQILNGLTSESGSFATPYFAAVDNQINSSSNSQRTTTRLLLLRFLVWLALVLPLLIWIATSTRRRYNEVRSETLLSQQSLNQVRHELTDAHETVLALERIKESETDFVSTLNHELRTPLTSIIGYLDILKDFTAVENDREFHNYLGVMDRNAILLYDLVDSILLLSALDSQQTLSEPAMVDLVELCESALAGQVLAIKTAHLKVRNNYREGEYYTVQGNKTLLTQVFTNLISNAVKFSPERARININFTRKVDHDRKFWVKVEVVDQGLGIPAEDIPQLFSRFFRASNAISSDIPGTGLGLMIVKRIVELHQGIVSVVSEVGQGTSMIVEFPLAVSPLEELIMGKREGVLERAISSISDGPVEKLGEITHDMGGAIGFYTFEEESDKLLQFSRWLAKNPDAQLTEVGKKREELLEMLNQTLLEVRQGGSSSGE